ncbi:MAG TPA: hypothetical protein VG939_06060 [Caulobacteraceae bacterium]|nr:hypothetical protein [Caulobacteraceae bacterium]
MTAVPPSEPLNTARVFARTFAFFRVATPELLLIGAISTLGSVGVSLAFDPFARSLIGQQHPWIDLAGWAAQFPVFVLSDIGLAVAGLMILGTGRVRLRSLAITALVAFPAALAIDLVENLPDLIDRSFQHGQGPSMFHDVGAILIGAAWNVVWMPALAVAAEEKAGPVASLRRSFDLVRGQWWRVFSFTILIHVAPIVVPLLILAPIAAITGLDIPGWVAAAVATPFFAFGSASQATIYWELVRLKDGVNPREVSTIFD